jgi:uncharacterized damage-inducible protein DinB
MSNEVLIDYLRYSRWASSTLLDACEQLTEEELHHDLRTAYPTVWATLVHIYQADCTWWTRFQRKHVSSLSEFEPGSSIAELRERWMRTLAKLQEFAQSRTEEQWREMLIYHNTKGTEFQQPLWQAFMHMANHATLHRGQILAMFRQLDRVPPSVDIMNYSKETMVS